MAAPDGLDSPMFRASKRRKVAQRRPLTFDNELPDEDASSASIEVSHEPALTTSAIVKGKKQARKIQNAADIANVTRGQSNSPAIDAVAPAKPADHHPFTNRFVAQTGQVVDEDDKQLTAYVEARMAKKRAHLYAANTPEPVPTAHIDDSTAGKNVAPGPVGRTSQDMYATGMSKLQEVDVGPDTTTPMSQRIEEAQRRPGGGNSGSTPPTQAQGAGSGKPRRRWQKRRNSEDIRRDNAVEQVLRETRLEYYDEGPKVPPPGHDDHPTDDTVAEQFRREFLESMEERNQRKPAPPPGPKGMKEMPKGPKLGGSRSARAAMKLQEEQAAKKKR